MTTDKKDRIPNAPNKGLVPKLRFPEFVDEWKVKRLGDDCEIQMCKRIFANQTSEIGDVPFYKIGTIGGSADAFISKELFSEYKAKYNFPQKGEVLITCAGTVGKTVIYDGEDAYYQDSNIVWISNPRQYYTNAFLQRVLSRINWSKLNTTTIVRIYNDNLRDLKIAYPSIVEQGKISSLLGLIDERITTQSRAIEDLKMLRVALYHKVFSTIQGETVSLQTIAKIVKGQQINGTELSDSGDYYVMNGGIVPSGYYNEYNTPANTISISEGGNSCGYIQFNDTPFWSGGHCYTLQLKGEIELLYLYHFLKYKETDIMALRIGSGLPNIQKKDLEHFPILLPNIKAQKKYADFFNCLKQKEDVEALILNLWQKQKHYLLRSLFI